MMDYLTEKKEQLLDGELTMTKVDFWLIVLLVFVLGVLYGLKTAPLTHGMTFKCGNNNGSNNVVGRTDDDECECIGCCECDDDECDDEDVVSFL